MMKKTGIAILLFILCISLVACGGGGGQDPAADTPPQAGGIGQPSQGTDETPEDPSEPVTGKDERTDSDDGIGSDPASTILVVYFSATGTTKAVAETVASVTGADLFEIIPEEPYSEDDLNYQDDNSRANREQQDENARPAISGSIENLDAYDVILIGHPIWWGMEPRIIDTFMESYDFSGKTLANFCTSGGSGISTSTENLKALSPDADWLDGRRFSASASPEDVREWIDAFRSGATE